MHCLTYLIEISFLLNSMYISYVNDCIYIITLTVQQGKEEKKLYLYVYI